MTARRILLVVIPVLIVLVLAGGAALAWLLLRPHSSQARLLVMGDTNVRLLEDGGKERVLVSDAFTEGYGFPAPSPDGGRLAFVVSDDKGWAVVRLDLASDERKELYRSSNSIPLDLAWSPDSKYLTFLLDGGNSVQVVAADGSAPAQQVGSGPPSYFAWDSAGSTLLLHLEGHTAEGGHVDTYQPGAVTSSQVITDPGWFQAPAWAIDGKHFFYVAQPPPKNSPPTPDDIKSDIVRVSADGKEPATLVSEGIALLRMVRAPTSDQIAYALITPDGIGGLKLVDGAGGAARVLSREGEHVTAFFWSPDGKRIAYLTYAGEYIEAGPRTWHVVDIADGAVRDFGAFEPSAAFVGLQFFFDAYTFSFSPWSPDSGRLAYGAKDGVYVIDLTAGESSRIADGTLGMWIRTE
jgi:TolB protein